MTSDRLVENLQALDAPQARYCELERYATGTQALAFLSPESRAALGNRMSRMASNLPKLAVASLAERLRITGFTGADVWADWVANDLDQLCAVSHREALTLGSSFVLVWADAAGKPRVSLESARQTAVIVDPGSRETVSAVKRWRGTAETWATLYLPDRVEKWHANTAGAATAGYDLTEVIDNPLGVVPVVELRNTDTLLGCGASEIDDLVPLVDGLNKILADMMVAAEYTARPRRWATGIELVERPMLDDDGNPVLDGDDEPVMETVNPIPENNRAMIAEPENAKFGSLPGAALDGYENAVNVLLSQVMAVSALPAHFVGITTSNPSSADALRAAEASLTARAEARQQIFGRAWEQVARLVVAVRDGVDVAGVQCRVQWADAATRSFSQEADGITKMFAAKLLSREGALRRLGYTDDEIAAELNAKSAEVQNEDPMGMFYARQTTP